MTEQMIEKRTGSAFMWSRILGIPFWVMLNTLWIILYKEFHVSPFLVTFLIALKPMTALLATYWSCFFSGSNRNFILTNTIRFLPFLFIFTVQSPWVLILCFSIYMILSRGSMPVWTELFRNHLPDRSRSRLFALGNTFEYIGTMIAPLLIGILLDYRADSWRWLFPLTAAIGITSTFFLLRLPNVPSTVPAEMKKDVLLPWKKAFTAIKTRPDFRRYLIGFMLGGAGLMVIQPILPIFFVDELNLSYTEMMLAIAVCKGIGYAVASPFWVKLFKQIPLFRFSFLVVLLACCFPLLLIGAKVGAFWLVYVAYLGYGYMQSGSELSWHLSPVSFAHKEESYVFTETNILAVGVRGCFIPFLGGLLYTLFNSVTVMVAGSLFCLSGSLVLATYRRQERPSVSPRVN